ncbi:MAG: hypothetical protein R6V06_01950 [Kiritimatiellia bacterium]
MIKNYLFSLLFLAALSEGASGAQSDIKNKQLNDAMAERAVLMVESHKIREKLDKSWSDKKYSSPEIEKLRSRYQKLRVELIKLREELKKEVGKLPEIQKLETRISEMRSERKELEDKIQKLNKKAD